MIYNVVKYNPRTSEFTLWKREWSFQGDRPDYTFLSKLNMETAITMVNSGERADSSMSNFMKEIGIKTYDLEKILKRIEVLEEFRKNWKRLHMNEHRGRQDNP